MNKMTADNAAKIKEIDAEIEDAEKNLGNLIFMFFSSKTLKVLSYKIKILLLKNV